MIPFEFQEVFAEIDRRHRARETLEQFARDEASLAFTAEAIHKIIQPARDKHDRWMQDADGSSRPGVAVNIQSLREGVRRQLGQKFAEAAFQEALVLCTVNRRARIRYYAIWQALQDLVHETHRQTSRADHIRHYFDLLIQQEKEVLRTAVTDSALQFRLHRDPETGQIRLGQLINWRSRIDHHYYFLSVFGYEPAYVELGGGEYLYFDSLEIRD